MITPRTLKGFRDFLPDLMLPRKRLIESATDVYRSYISDRFRYRFSCSENVSRVRVISFPAVKHKSIANASTR
jgi:hypothetical protein